MQAPHRFLTTSQRRQRLVLWALTMLAWIAAVLFSGKEINVRQLKQRYRRVSLDGLTRMVIDLMIVRAAELARRRPRKRCFFKHGRDLKRPHLIRSLLGSRLRRALKHKDVATRIAILIGVLRNLDACAQHLAQRMRHGLTRLWAITIAPTIPAALCGAPASSPTFSDSS